MSPRVSRVVPPRGAGSSSQRIRLALNVDLNVPPSDHSHSYEAGSLIDPPVIPQSRARVQRTVAAPVTIDVDSIEDDIVVLSSPTAFVEAKNNSRRTRSRSNVVDVELEESSNRDAANIRNKRRRVPSNQPIVDCESYAVPEMNGHSVNGNSKNMPTQIRIFVAPPPPPPPPPPEPIFSCPVCMGPLVEEVSTKCGHIFCKACIKTAIAVQGKCPTCRRKMTMKDTIKIYLPKRS